jgi:hypothetical protein
LIPVPIRVRPETHRSLACPRQESSHLRGHRTLSGPFPFRSLRWGFDDAAAGIQLGGSDRAEHAASCSRCYCHRRVPLARAVCAFLLLAVLLAVRQRDQRRRWRSRRASWRRLAQPSSKGHADTGNRHQSAQRALPASLQSRVGRRAVAAEQLPQHWNDRITIWIVAQTDAGGSRRMRVKTRFVLRPECRST